MLLLEITVNTVLKRISDRLLTLEHTWYPFIASFSPPQYQTATDYGGFVRLGFGDVSISPELFESDWPPPLQCDITAKYTATDEAAATTLITTTGHLTHYDRELVTYKIQDIEYQQDLLAEIDDYDGNTVVVPRGFGAVTHVTPIRLPDVDIGLPYGAAPTYHLGGLVSTTLAFRIIGFTSYSAGAATKIITGDIDGDPLNHGYGNGETVHIVGSDNFNGAHVISNAAGSTFTIPVAFAQESLPIYASVFQAGHVQVFDDGIPIPENFYNNGDGTFSLKATPVGQVTISGTGSQTTLSDVLSWGQVQLFDNGIPIVDTYARSPSPTVSRWVTSQTTVLNFLSSICASFTHIFYIASDTINLVDMYIDNGSTTLTEFEFFAFPKYGKFAPVKELASAWQTFSAETGTSGGEHDLSISHYIKTTEHDISEELYEYGTELGIPAFHDDEANVRTCLINIREILKKDKVSISVPVSATLPAPGEKLSWEDTTLPVDIPGYIRTRTLAFDFLNGQVMVTGEGTFLQPADMGSMSDTTIAAPATATIDSFAQSLAKGAVWDYVVDDGAGTNMRIGRICAVWNQAAGSTPKLIADEFSTDIGTTIGIVSFSVVKVATVVHLQCTTTAGSWTISVSRKTIG